MDQTGKITKVLPIQTGAKKDGTGDWKKQLFILDNGEKYNNIFCFEIFGDEKVDKFNQYNKEGSYVKVDFNVSTNEWQGKYFTSLQAWKVFKAESSEPAPFAPAPELKEEELDDLPF